MEIRLLEPGDADAVRRLMDSFGLSVPEHTEFELGAFEGARLRGCCSFKDGLVQGLCIDRDAQQDGLMALLVQAAIKRAGGAAGVITKPEAAIRFEALGFRRVAGAEPYSVYLEFGRGGLGSETARLRAAADGLKAPRAAVVLNANPFTVGHLALIERAASENETLFALVVSEDKSAFSFEARLAMVEAGTAHLPNVRVLPAGPYVVSSRTFPAYFTKSADLASAQGAMDAALFAAAIGPALGTTKRYVGTEPLSETTAAYNAALRARLPRAGIELIEIERIKDGAEPVSASAVRAALGAGDLDRARRMVPETTWALLAAARMGSILQNEGEHAHGD